MLADSYIKHSHRMANHNKEMILAIQLINTEIG
jgi:hypothetical protein